jgi:molybdenum cofactor sulfurtransferase
MAYATETTYLDHAGTTLYAKSLVTAISHDLTHNLFGNPHSGSSSSQLSSRRIDDTRLQVLRFLNADPDLFDIVFVANATAAIKLVAEALRDHAGGFWYGYHVDSHTSLVGVRELAGLGSQCFVNDEDVNQWLSALRLPSVSPRSCTLFGYPGQSNLSGYRPPLNWCSKIYQLRRHRDENIYSLYDAAAWLSTAPMDFSDPLHTPDFTAFSFYKIFGLPDLGALIVRKECSHIFYERKFFGGGTADMVVSLGAQWHANKQSSLHSRLEDGTVPFHSIIASGLALSTHSRLFGSMHNISLHTSFLAERVHRKLSCLRHSTGMSLCQFYGRAAPNYVNSQGPTIAFNLRDADGKWIGKSEVEKLAAIRSIQLRTGGLCNPGGIATHLQLSASELSKNFAAGQRCGDDNDILNGKPTGVIRVSFGAMSNIEDADTFVEFIEEFFLRDGYIPLSPPLTPPATSSMSPFHVQSLSVFPIKSCAAFKIPSHLQWEIRDEGLAWDRQWCLIHLSTGVALNQKKYPQMALLHPIIDLERRVLRVQHDIDTFEAKTLEVSLDSEVGSKCRVQRCNSSNIRSAMVCGECQEVQVSKSAEVADFFTAAMEVPCTLARHQKVTTAASPGDQSRLDTMTQSIPGYFPVMRIPPPPKTTLLANDSPILLISQSSVNNLNLAIQSNDPDAKLVPAASFRGNIVIAQDPRQKESPYVEDQWSSVQIGDDPSNQLRVLGPCHRCQMVCVDQQSGKRRQEPFSTLAKTRRRDGKVWFGMYLSPVMGKENRGFEGKRFIRVGDAVKPQWE